MAIADPVRTQYEFVTDHDLSEIRQRLGSRLTDDGFRAWYQHDVVKLFAGVMAFRELHAKVLARLQGPVHDLAEGVSLIVVADRLADYWQQQEEGLYKAVEMRRLRERLETSRTAAREADQRAAALQGQVQHLLAELMQARRAYDQVRDLEEAVQRVQSALAGSVQQVDGLKAEVTGLTKQRDDLTVNRQRLISLLQAEAEKVERLRVLTAEVSSVLTSDESVQVALTDSDRAVEVLKEEVAILTKQRDGLTANRKKLIALLQAETAKVKRLRALSVEVSSVLAS